MPELVPTTLGLIDRAKLERTVHCTDEPGKVIVAIEWRLNADLVRRDEWVNVLVGEATTAGAAA
jgi:hypothetical protein